MEDLELFIEPSASLLLTKISHFLTEQGIKSYLIGGFVRDVLLRRDTVDIDIAVAADAPEIAAKVATAFSGKHVLLDRKNRIGRVVLNNEGASTRHKWELDFSTLKGDIGHDLAQRDFTIDAVAIDLEKFISSPLIAGERGLSKGSKVSPELLIDPFNGWDDIRQGVLRAVAETIFQSDAARLLRAVRLAAELGFSIDKETEILIRRFSHLIANSAGERVREELLRLLAKPQAGQHLRYLDELGLLTVVIPELAQTKGVEQPRVHFWNVFDHSIQTVAAVEFLLRQGSWQYATEEMLAAVPWSAMLSQHFDQTVSSGSTRGSLLKLAALLHDIAKPQTKTVDDSGRARFLGHATEGAVITASILERLRFSAKEIKLVAAMVKHHLRPTQMSQDEFPSRRAIYRYFRDTEEASIDILFLNLADHLATRGQHLDLPQWREHAQMVEYVLARHFEEESLIAPPKLIDGHDLINIFGLSPGPKVGEVLATVREAQAAGEAATKEKALAYVGQLLASPPAKR